MNKILVSDYDKTLYINDEDLKINKEAVKKFRKNNNLFIIATGRSYLDFRKVVDKYNLEYDFAIINHGATILDNKDNIISNYIIDNNLIENLKKDLDLSNSIEWFCSSTLNSRLNFNYKDLTKINIKYKSQEQSSNILNKVKNKYSNFINIYNINNSRLEIVSSKASKYKSLKLLIDKLNIDKKNIYTIGDGYSDIEMVKNFNGYCMKNSIDEIKKIALKQYESVSDLIYDIENNF